MVISVTAAILIQGQCGDRSKVESVIFGFPNNTVRVPGKSDRYAQGGEVSSVNHKRPRNSIGSAEGREIETA